MNTLDLKTLDSTVLVFGGPYGNLQATTAIKQIAEQRGIRPGNVICTGDVVAYCGDPENTVNLIRRWGCHVVMGNCEESVGYEADDCACGFEENSLCAVLSVDWYNHAMNQVSTINKLWMQSLPRQIRFSVQTSKQNLKFSVVHGGIDNISEFVFESSDPGNKLNQIKELESDCIIGGHCGIPFGQKLQNKYWLNAGVIGLPANEGQSHSWYMLLDQQKDHISASWHHLEFDNQGAITAMDKAGLSKAYQLTLSDGLWPSMSVLPESERNRQGQSLNPATITLLAS